MSDPLLRHSSAGTCDERALRQFLDDEIGDSAKRELEDHLTECESCRRRLEAIAASDEIWVTAKESRIPDETALLLEEHWQKLRRALDTSSESSTLSATVSVLESRSSDVLASDDRQSSRAAQKEILRRWLEPSLVAGALGRIGKYDIFDIVGQGGMGLVLSGIDSELRREVAIKTLSQPLTLDEQAGQRLEREARAVASIRHNHVVPIYGMEIWCGVPVLVMPLIHGGTLHEYAAKNQLTVPQALRVGIQIADALTALHEQGVVHRDLKPSNILICDGLEHVMLSDFGLARAQGDFTVTRTGAMAGTPYFMSPEHAMGNDVDARSDLFSLGCVLFWLLTGSHVYDGDHPFVMVQNLAAGKSHWEQLGEKAVPEPIQTLLARLLDAEPSRRWEDAGQVRTLLQHCLAAFESHEYELPIELTAAAQRLSTRPLIGQLTLGQSMRSPSVRQIAIAIGLVSLVAIGWNFVGNHQPKSLVEDRPPSFGALDDLDRLAIQDDLTAERNLRYWLRRLAALSVDEVPAESLPEIQSLAQHTDPTIRELAQVILNKNPFQEVDEIP